MINEKEQLIYPTDTLYYYYTIRYNTIRYDIYLQRVFFNKEKVNQTMND